MSESICSTVLEQCLRGEPWSRALLAELHAPELFSVLAEGLSDRFEPSLAGAYADIFCEVIAAARPELNAGELRARFERVRRARPFEGAEPRVIFVLSRVTLGADVAITSVLFDALKRRFPNAQILFVAPRKSYELFAADPRIAHLAAAYGGGIEQRLRAPWFDEPESIVVDPDSRITQLGLLPVCPEQRYYFFESRSYGGDGDETLTALARRWAGEVFGVTDARPYIAPAARPATAGGIAVSLGVGDNQAKRIGGDFEARLLAELAATGLPVAVDSGGSAEEAARVRKAVEASGAHVQVLCGPFAAFAAAIASSRLYVGYDSAGQHVAAACGIPLISIFKGCASERFFERWRPSGDGRVEIVRAGEDGGAVLARVSRILRDLSLAGPH